MGNSDGLKLLFNFQNLFQVLMAEKNGNFIGIDLGGKNKKTTGVCILGNKKIILLKDIFGKDIFKTINPYLENTKVIAIDAPLTIGMGKGRMRLYEKFLSTKIFRKEKVNPIPPALMPDLSYFGQEIVKKIEKRGFVLNINLIEVFPTLVEKIGKREFFLNNFFWQTENQKSALICALLAFLHSQFRTCYLGYKDGFLFLPEISFWKKVWLKKFSQAWQEKDPLKYRRLITNIFDKKLSSQEMPKGAIDNFGKLAIKKRR